MWLISAIRLNVTTWSVTTKTLQGTAWPTILRSDNARTTLVLHRVGIASTALASAAILFVHHLPSHAAASRL
jgi:hypothetical protein